MRSKRHEGPQTLLFDADDTLWENNIYFEQAIAAFISHLDHHVHTPEEVRDQLNRCERATIAEFGYGLTSFRRSLVQCFELLTDAPITPERHARIVSFTDAIASEEIELLQGAEATLRDLFSRHRLFLVTKGDQTEQTGKLERSGLKSLFAAVEVPAEKDERMYRDLIRRHGLTPGQTWMIGNSPRSDVNPALAAGLNAVYIPHRSTWILEHEPIEPARGAQCLLELTSFPDLLDHF